MQITPKQLFLIDGIGAIISAFLLGIVLVEFEGFFGIPIPTLYLLAAFPVVFALFDFYCFWKVERGSGMALKTIAIMNVLYCFLSIVMAGLHSDSITSFGWIYIGVEVLIVLSLAAIEFNAGRKLFVNQNQS